MKSKIVCPKCNEEFDAPRWDKKRFGFCAVPPGVGFIKCPYCKYKAHRSEFSVAEDTEE